jgi:hypothetical protein
MIFAIGSQLHWLPIYCRVIDVYTAYVTAIAILKGKWSHWQQLHSLVLRD